MDVNTWKRIGPELEMPSGETGGARADNPKSGVRIAILNYGITSKLAPEPPASSARIKVRTFMPIYYIVINFAPCRGAADHKHTDSGG